MAAHTTDKISPKIPIANGKNPTENANNCAQKKEPRSFLLAIELIFL